MVRRVSWDDLMKIRFDTPVASLPFAVDPVPSVDGVVAVPGIEAYVNTKDDKARGVWWATDLTALERVLHDRVSEDGGLHKLDPPAELLPRGADRRGTFGTVARSLRSQGLAHGVTGGYTRSGRWNYREMSTGKAGFGYVYRERSGDTDPVAVISISLARQDWVPDRAQFRRGASVRSPIVPPRALFKRKPSIDALRQAWGDSLRQAGLWSELPQVDQMDRVARLSQGERLVATLEGVGWTADGEDLAEGTVEDLLKSMKPALAKRGVRLLIRTVDSPQQPNSPGYAIDINGRVLDLYRFGPDDPSLPLSEDPWLDCTMLPLRRVNELLAEAATRDRLVVFEPGGNDGFVLLSSPAMLEALMQAPASTERPAIP